MQELVRQVRDFTADRVLNEAEARLQAACQLVTGMGTTALTDPANRPA